jgi:hypothetical protein
VILPPRMDRALEQSPHHTHLRPGMLLNRSKNNEHSPFVRNILRKGLLCVNFKSFHYFIIAFSPYSPWLMEPSIHPELWLLLMHKPLQSLKGLFMQNILLNL